MLVMIDLLIVMLTLLTNIKFNFSKLINIKLLINQTKRQLSNWSIIVFGKIKSILLEARWGGGLVI